MANIRFAKNSDLDEYWNHISRHANESGKDGDHIFAPFEDAWDRPLAEFKNEKITKWDKSVTQVGWERCWLVTDQDAVYGALRLVQQPELKTSLHRATLMMGIERNYRGRGLGTQLINEAINWAKHQPSLEWLQLYVFLHNTPAKKLYEQFGFTEVGTTPDLFRVHGQKIDDVSMVLKLK